jgi:hypothetical protein
MDEELAIGKKQLAKAGRNKAIQAQNKAKKRLRPVGHRPVELGLG